MERPITLGWTPFQTPSAILGPLGSHFGFCNIEPNIELHIGFCRWCGVAGGERVPPARLGWYSYNKVAKNIFICFRTQEISFILTIVLLVFIPVLLIFVIAVILARMTIHVFTHKIVVIRKYMNFTK